MAKFTHFSTLSVYRPQFSEWYRNVRFSLSIIDSDSTSGMQGTIYKFRVKWQIFGQFSDAKKLHIFGQNFWLALDFGLDTIWEVSESYTSSGDALEQASTLILLGRFQCSWKSDEECRGTYSFHNLWNIYLATAARFFLDKSSIVRRYSKTPRFFVQLANYFVSFFYNVISSEASAIFSSNYAECNLSGIVVDFRRNVLPCPSSSGCTIHLNIALSLLRYRLSHFLRI